MISGVNLDRSHRSQVRGQRSDDRGQLLAAFAASFLLPLYLATVRSARPLPSRLHRTCRCVPAKLQLLAAIAFAASFLLHSLRSTIISALSVFIRRVTP